MRTLFIAVEKERLPRGRTFHFHVLVWQASFCVWLEHFAAASSTSGLGHAHDIYKLANGAKVWHFLWVSQSMRCPLFSSGSWWESISRHLAAILLRISHVLLHNPSAQFHLPCWDSPSWSLFARGCACSDFGKWLVERHLLWKALLLFDWGMELECLPVLSLKGQFLRHYLL